MYTIHSAPRCRVIVGLLAAAIALGACVTVGPPAGVRTRGEAPVAQAAISQPGESASTLPASMAPRVIDQPPRSESAAQAPVAPAPAAPAAPAPAAPAVPAVPAAVTPVIDIRMDDFRFAPEMIRLKAGQEVRLKFFNDGKIPHEFVVGREVEVRPGKTDGYKTDLFAGLQMAHTVDNGSVKNESGRGINLQLKNGGTATLTLTAPVDRVGNWEVGCFLPGHYEAGMKGALVVE